MSSQQYQDNIATLRKKVEEAEAIVVGGASGMSAAAGYNWYQDDPMFRKYFNAFAEEYGIDSIFGGFYYKFLTEEERWAYLGTLINFVAEVPIGQPYKDLYDILRDKNYYILTTNQDTQFSQVFPEEKSVPFRVIGQLYNAADLVMTVFILMRNRQKNCVPTLKGLRFQPTWCPNVQSVAVLWNCG